jgi:hypothetical protein
MEFPAEWAVFQADEFHTRPPLTWEGGYGADDSGEAERKAPGSLSHCYRRLRDFGGQVPTHRHNFQRRVGGSDCPVPVLGTRRKPAKQHDDLRVAGRVRADQEQRAQAGDSRRGAYQSGEDPQHPRHDDGSETEVGGHLDVRRRGPGRQNGAGAASPASTPGNGQREAVLLRVSTFIF